MRATICTIVSRGDWLWKAANIKNVNSSAVGYVGSSRHSTILCFSALKLWRNNFMRCFSWSLRSKWLRIVLVNIVEHLQLSTKIYNRGRASYPFHSINYACNYWSMESLLMDHHNAVLKECLYAPQRVWRTKWMKRKEINYSYLSNTLGRLIATPVLKRKGCLNYTLKGWVWLSLYLTLKQDHTPAEHDSISFLLIFRKSSIKHPLGERGGLKNNFIYSNQVWMGSK